MHFTSSIAQAILCLSVTVNASIAIGNQIREGKSHFNVAWVEGVSPCQGDVEIALESSKLCNQNFQLNGESYYLVGCTDPNTGYAQKPQRLRRVKDNSLYGTCAPVSKKTINCKGSTHDVVKRYICG
ncbi:uncharacterized protein TrAtP1_009006 [Trichoderma atroviride]|uniref:SSCRP protein n=1 Tax=Hypocrea atroviridis (strain ATCC 20476 / IMI 206040) TaxID=452589 RepID=G9NYE6_HYPAI|nr:uncharacterized protein TRIATDRAFT_138574 [Trichoderma atroviride IMI 206040]EHK44615.1 hypothetical protein TRIATDRAFT_138574 [Trichoderma atroviride IMI 206040]UKZ67848.1 hypothetical protein TrAtP1_009006 [Trichoderma atroviride]